MRKPQIKKVIELQVDLTKADLDALADRFGVPTLARSDTLAEAILGGILSARLTEFRAAYLEKQRRGAILAKLSTPPPEEPDGPDK